MGSNVKASQLPDDVMLLKDLEKEEIIVKTPSQDYDDSYCLKYARENNGHILSNDKFRDYLAKLKEQKGPETEKLERAWIRSHLISYTFSG